MFPNFECLLVLRTRKHSKFGSFLHGSEQFQIKNLKLDGVVAVQPQSHRVLDYFRVLAFMQGGRSFRL
jgi:hypothetical protein